MKKANKILMAAVAILLSLVLISTSVLSGVFAKFVITDKADISVGFTKWGITVTSGSDVAAEYKNSDNTVMIKSNSHNVIAPGTHGCLAWFKVQSSGTEVKFKLDFECTNFEIGTGYSSSSKYVRDANGNAVDHFPIIFYLVAYDLDANDNITGVTAVNDTDKASSDYTTRKIDYIINHQRQIDGKKYAFVKTSLNSGTYAFNNIHTGIEAVFRGNYSSGKYPEIKLSNVFDQTFVLNSNTGKVDSFKRVYTIQWCWPYNADSTYPNNSIGVSTNGTYYNQSYDTQIGEAMKNNIGDFAITLDMSLTVEQIQ